MNVRFYFWLACLVVVFNPVCFFAKQSNTAFTSTPYTMSDSTTVNSAHYVDVTRVDGFFVKRPIISSDFYREDIADSNTSRMKAIMSSSAIGKYCQIHFPAGVYYFNGAASGWDASIQSTAKNQSFTGDGINATRIIQKNLVVPATIKISNSNCTVQNLSIMSADYQQKYNRQWDEHPLQTAILFEASRPWHTDPKILNVNINTTGNDIIVNGFYRPFKTGIKFIGPWLNVFVHTMFIQHVHNAIYINQGNMIAGPAKFIDVNAYGTAPTKTPHVWNVFFKSEGHFMEQVELIHDTYIGSQFIYMDGTKLITGGSNFTKPPTNPVYNMVIERCYINTLWLPLPSDDPKWSGIYFNLPPRPGGIYPSFGSQLYSRKIIFTNNFCGGKTPRDGAFFYVEGNLEGLTIHGNDFASGGGDRAIYIRATKPLINTDVAVKNVEITQNYFNDFRNPIAIGNSWKDPSRIDTNNQQKVIYPSGVGKNPSRIGIVPGNIESIEKSDSSWVDGVMITGNQTFYLPNLKKIQLTGVFLNRARHVIFKGNKFAPTNGSSLILLNCKDVIINGNILQGLAEKGQKGIQLIKSKNVNLTGNMVQGFNQGIGLYSDESAVLSSNNLEQCKTALLLRRTLGATVSANMISEAGNCLSFRNLQDVSVSGNTIIRSGPPVINGKNEGLQIHGNTGIRLSK